MVTGHCVDNALRYHVPVHPLAQRLLVKFRREELFHAGDRVGVAVSGGIDSVALLRLLLELRTELGIVLSVVHFNHKLRGKESDADAQFAADLAREYGLEFRGSSGDVAALAAERHGGIEAAAREMRYGFFGSVLEETSGKIATGHTLDDQTETVLMRLIRGTGLRGLGGIHPRVVVEDDDGEAIGEIIRPLLGVRRRELQQYLNDLGQAWREDSSNEDAKFTRNRLRKLVVPLLEREFNPALGEGLAEIAEIARDEEDYWDGEVSGWLGTVVQWSEADWARRGDAGLVQIDLAGGRGAVMWDGVERNTAAGENEVLRSAQDDNGFENDDGLAGGAFNSNDAEGDAGFPMNAAVSRPWLLTEPRAVQRRVLKAIGDEASIPLEFKHIEEILRFAVEDGLGGNGATGKQLSLPLGWKVLREAEAIVFLAPDPRRTEPVPDYAYEFAIPGRIVVPELGGAVEALEIRLEDGSAEYNPQQLLRQESLPERLTLRNWRPGDRYWPAHTKAPRKVKELLQERHIQQPDRRLWPVLLSGEEIVWMRGFPVPARLRAGSGEAAILIREMRLERDEDEI